MNANSMIREAERSLGLGEPNHIQDWYAARNGSAYSYNFAWCDAAITYWAVKSGNYSTVCPNGDRAYTVSHAADFDTIGRWHYDIAGIRRGDIVFFDWSYSDDIGRIDHVGVVTAVKGSRVYTIEGNTSNRCLRRVRTASVIVGYGRPAYGNDDEEDDPLLGLEKGDKGRRVKALQVLLKGIGGEVQDALGHYGPGGDGVDSDYGKATAESLRLARKSVGSKAKKGWGDRVSPHAYAQLMRAVARAEARKV